MCIKCETPIETRKTRLLFAFSHLSRTFEMWKEINGVVHLFFQFTLGK